MRNCGASGISWWQFQDTYYGLEPNDSNASDYRESFFGLLNPGNWDSVTGYSTFRKPAVEDFRTFDPTEPPGDFPEPSGLYYNPFNYNTNNNYTITGLVLDFETGSPIEGAVVILNSFVRDILGDSTKSKTGISPHYTFTDKDGVFNAYPTPKIYYATTIDDIKISYPGYERVERGWSSDYNPPPSIGVTNHDTIRIKKKGFAYDESLQNITISGGISKYYQGWNSVSASAFLVQSGGNCEITARREINLLPSFEVCLSGELNVFLSETFPKCPEFQTFLKETEQTTTSSTEIPKELKLCFSVENDNCDILYYPNPSSGLISIRVTNDISEFLKINIFNIAGEKILERIFMTKDLIIDLSFLQKGYYIMEMEFNDIVCYKKLIIK